MLANYCPPMNPMPPCVPQAAPPAESPYAQSNVALTAGSGTPGVPRPVPSRSVPEALHSTATSPAQGPPHNLVHIMAQGRTHASVQLQSQMMARALLQSRTQAPSSSPSQDHGPMPPNPQRLTPDAAQLSSNTPPHSVLRAPLDIPMHISPQVTLRTPQVPPQTPRNMSRGTPSSKPAGGRPRSRTKTMGSASPISQASGSSDGEKHVRKDVKIPWVLPRPVLAPRTNPHVDLAAHLQRYGLEAEAYEVQRAGLSFEYVLAAYMMLFSEAHSITPSTVPAMRLEQLSICGHKLMLELDSAVGKRQAGIQRQMFTYSGMTPQASGCILLPTVVHVDALTPEDVPAAPGLHDLASHDMFVRPVFGMPPPMPMPASFHPVTPEHRVLPTHFLALYQYRGDFRQHSTTLLSLGRPAYVLSAAITLVPVHWLVYVLQCASLPQPTRMELVAYSQGDVLPVPGTCGVDAPVLAFGVPYPRHWMPLHLWLYTRDKAKLLASLLPIGYMELYSLTQTWTSARTGAVDALARLEAEALKRILFRIRAVWHNGRRVGVYDERFWEVLAHAWEMAVAALAARKALRSAVPVARCGIETRPHQRAATSAS